MSIESQRAGTLLHDSDEHYRAVAEGATDAIINDRFTQHHDYRQSDRPRIAVVDDDQSVREALENLIGSAGYEVDLFESAEAFLESAEINNTVLIGAPFRGLGGV